MRFPEPPSRSKIKTFSPSHTQILNLISPFCFKGAKIKTTLDNNGNKINSLSLLNTDDTLECPRHQYAHVNLGNFTGKVVYKASLRLYNVMKTAYWVKMHFSFENNS